MASPSETVRWARIEPRSRDKSLRPGLEARVHDPLWLIGRQWQFGELTADGDLGSAIVAEISASVAPLARYRPGRVDEPRAAQAYDVAAQPLETLVEAEDGGAGDSLRARARAGQHFERLLAAHGVARYAAAYRRVFAVGAEASPIDASGRRFVRLVAGRAIDGSRLRAALFSSLRPSHGGPPSLPAVPQVAERDLERVRAAAEAWLAWFDSLVTTPARANTAWMHDRMEYAFAVEATAADGSGVVLEADEYADGTLDWHTFSAAPTTVAPAGGEQIVGPRTVVPTAVSYPGMPASRLWEFEDARVDFGGVEANPEDLGRMVVTEFALVYGGDWLLIPLEVPTGSLVRIKSLDVRDTFGRVVRVTPTTSLEPATAGWRVFEISPRLESDAAGRRNGARDALLVAPALASGLQGRAIEEVLLLRDEMANMAWAVERSVEGAQGLPVDRAASEYERRPDPPGPSVASDTLSYRLRTEVPRHWLPLLPQRLQASDPSMTLRLAALPSIEPHGTIVPIRPLGRLLAPAVPGGEVVLREEEVPREGARVTRAYQLARWFDGTTFLWLGRRKAVGRGEGSSGLSFDVAE